MSKINTIRIINLHYNHDFNQIDDLVIDANGENTLINLTNGGGKSTLIQLITALFVHKRYRNVNQGGKDRPFGDFFTPNHRPSFLMVEWLRDDGVSKVLTGAMVYRVQSSLNEGDSLKMLNFIAEYRDHADYDIRHIPVIENKHNQRQPITYNKGKDLLSKYRNRHQMFVYDMNDSAQARKYFNKLDENKIPPKEWESIIHKINEDESGVVKMFSDCTTAPDLLKKVLLPAVEDKLNNETSHMGEFQEMTEAYITQCYQNESKIEENKKAQHFDDDLMRIESEATSLASSWQKEKQAYRTILGFKDALNNAANTQEENVQKEAKKIQGLYASKDQLDFEEKSYDLILANEAMEAQDEKLTHLSTQEKETREKREEANRHLHIQEAAQAHERFLDAKTSRDAITHEMEYAKKDRAPLEKEHDGLGYHLFHYYDKAHQNTQSALEQAKKESIATQNSRRQIKADLNSTQKALSQVESLLVRLETRQKDYDRLEARFNKRTHKNYTRLLSGLYPEHFLDEQDHSFKAGLIEIEQAQEDNHKNSKKARNKLAMLDQKKEELAKKQTALTLQLHEIEAQLKRFEEQKEERYKILRSLDLGAEKLYDTNDILAAIEKVMGEKSREMSLLTLDIHTIDNRISQLETGQNVTLPKKLKKLMDDHGITYSFGGQWLKESIHSAKVRAKVIAAHPFLPYAILVSQKDLDMLSTLLATSSVIYSDDPIPFLTFETIESRKKADAGTFYSLGDTSFYVLFDEKLLIEDELASVIESLTAKRARIIERQKTMASEYEHYQGMKVKLDAQDVTKEKDDHLQQRAHALKEEEALHKNEALEVQKAITQTQEDMDHLQKEEQDLILKKKDLELSYQEFIDLSNGYQEYVKRMQEINQASLEKKRLEDVYQSDEKRDQELEETYQRLSEAMYHYKNTLHDLSAKVQLYQGYTKDEGATFTTLEDMESRFSALDSRLSHERKDLEERFKESVKIFEREESNLSTLIKRYHLQGEDYQQVIYDADTLLSLTQVKETLDDTLNKLRHSISLEEKEAGRLEAKKESLMTTLQKNWPERTPLAKEDLKPQDYEIERQKLLTVIKQEEELLNTDNKRYELMNRILTSLDTYIGEDPLIYEEDLTLLSNQRLLECSSTLKNAYEKEKNERTKLQTQFVRVYDDTKHNEAYREGIFERSLRAIGQALDDAITQDDVSLLTITLNQVVSGFHQYTQALEATLDMLSKQKSEHVDSLYNYTRMLYEEIDKIDSHSAITLYERSHKMLMIHLPKWDLTSHDEREQSLYYTRIEDYYNELVEGGMQVYKTQVKDGKKSLHEYVRAHLTTSLLFEHAVNLHDLTIKVCKVTSASSTMQPIHWQEAITKFSDGETFLTSFIVLASLLYYMRYNETDFFSSKNDGKVLLMDNPFGKASAVHLLKPMMEIAKKNNIQLISLTAHDDETIRSCYDNIYVLKLQPSAFMPDRKKLITSEEVHKGDYVTMSEGHLKITDL